ncbi:MAG: FAD-dependent oxidoreductase [Gordonia sp. (in: high G+C Gram-positive bacteria)]
MRGLDVVVVGGGIAGLTAAAALQRRGHRVQVLEARDDTSPGAGISVWPNALAALDDIALGDGVRDAGTAVAAGAMRLRDGRWIRRASPETVAKALGEAPVMIERAALRDVLAGALLPSTVRHGVRVQGLTGPGVLLVDGARLDADLVVAADGAGSSIARELNGPLARTYAGYTAWRGVADLAMSPELAGQTLGRGIEAGHVPLGARQTYWFVAQRRPALRRTEGEWSPGADLAHLAALLRGWASPIPELIAATPPGALLRNDVYDRVQASRWVSGGVVLIGDAAHPMRPHLGQGGCQAIEDAVHLAAMLDDGPLDDALARFEAVRKRRVARVVGESRAIGRVLGVRPEWLADAGLRASSLLPELLAMRHLAVIAGRSAWRG